MPQAGTVPPPGPEALETRGPRLDDSDDFDARKFPEVQRLASLGREHSVGNRRERRVSERGRGGTKPPPPAPHLGRGPTAPQPGGQTPPLGVGHFPTPSPGPPAPPLH